MLSHSKRVIDASGMAARAVWTLNEVIDELKNLDNAPTDASSLIIPCYTHKTGISVSQPHLLSW